MAGIVLELQKEALDKDVRVSDLLRKALLVARKLKVPDIEVWINSELNGYEAKVPDYRMMRGEIKAWNPYAGVWMPMMFRGSDPNNVHEALTRRPLGSAISEIEALLAAPGDGELTMNYPPKVQKQLLSGSDVGSFAHAPVLIVQASRLHGVVDAVRTALLDWALKLEEQGILGENLSFSEAERQAASHITFNIGSMSHSQIQADTEHSQQIIAGAIDPAELLKFVAKARAALGTLALPTPANDELRGELDTLEAQAKSPKPKEGILRESAKTVRAILEGAAGNATAEALLIALRTLFGG